MSEAVPISSSTPVRGMEPPAPLHGSSQESERVSIVEMLTLLASNKRVILLSTFATGLLSVALSYAMHPRFVATTILLPPQQSSSSASAVLSQLGGLGSLGGGLGLKSPLDMYVSLMKSAVVEDAVIRRFDLQREYGTKLMWPTRNALEQKVKIDANTKDGLLRVSVTDGSAEKAAAIANGYVEEYRKLSANLAISEAGQRRLFFEQQLDAEKEKLAGAEESLKMTEQSTGLVEMDSQARALIQSAGVLRAQIASKEVQVASMRTYAAGGNIDLIQAEQELSSLKAQLGKLGGTEAAGNDLIVSKGKLPQVGLQYVRKLRDVKYHETLFEMLARQYEAAKLDEAKEGAPIQVVDPATPPDRRSSPSHALFLLVGLMAGGLFSCLYVILRAGLEDDPVANQRWSGLMHALFGRARA